MKILSDAEIEQLEKQNSKPLSDEEMEALEKNGNGRSWYEDNVPQLLKDAVGGVESVGRSIINLPSMAYDAGLGLTGKAIAVTGLAGEGAAKEKYLQRLQQEQQNSTNLLGKAVNAIKVNPLTKSGEIADEMMGEGFSTVARAPGAAVQAAFSGSGQTGAKQLINDPNALGPLATEIPVTLAGLVGGAKAVPGVAKGLSQFVKDPLGKQRAGGISSVEQAIKEQQATKPNLQPLEYEKVSPLDIEGNQFKEAPRNWNEDAIPYKEDVLSKPVEKEVSINEAVDQWKPDEKALRKANPDREYLKQQEIEQAYQQKAKQDNISVEVETPLPEQGTKLSEAFLRSQKDQHGAINPEVFTEGFERAKELVEGVLKGLKLVAYNQDGELYITALDQGGKPKALVQYEPKNGNLEAKYINVGNTFTGKKLTNEMYKFASELGNDIQASDIQTEGGKKMWSNFEKDGLTVPGQRMIAKSQRGSIGFFGKDPFEKFADKVRKEYPGIKDETIQRAWEIQQKNESKASVGIDPTKEKAMSNLPWWEDKLNKGFLPVEDIEKAKADLKNSTEDISSSTIRDKFASGGVVQAALTNHPVTRVGIQLINGLKKQAERFTNEALSNPKDGVLTLRKHIEKTMGDKQFQSDFLEYVRASLDSEYQPKYSELGQKWVDNLLKKQNEVFERANQIREQLGMRQLKKLNNYFSLMREGPFGFAVKDETGKLVGFIREKTMDRAEKAYRSYLIKAGDEGLNWSIGKPEYYPSLERSPFKKTAQQQQLMMADMIELLDPENPNVQKAMSLYQKTLLDEAHGTAGAKNREKFRSSKEGAKGTKDWLKPNENVKEGMEAIETYFRQMNDQTASLEAAKHLRDIITDESIDTPNAKKLISSYYDHAFGRVERVTEAVNGLERWIEETTGKNISTLLSGIRMTKNALMSMTLGFANARFLMTQVVQPWQAMAPMFGYLKDAGATGHALGARFEGFKDSIAYLAQQYSQHSRPWFQDKLTAAIWDYAEQNHITAAHLLDTVKEFSNPTVHKLINGKWGLSRFASGEMQIIESATRMHTFSAFTRFLVDSGMPIDLALKTADNLTEFTMVSYEKHNKPQIYSHLGFLGETSSALQIYKHNNLSQQVFYLKEASKGNVRGLAIQNVVTLMLAGMLGMYGLNELDNLMNWIRDKTGAQFMNGITPSEQILKHFPEWVSVGGLSSVTGFDFHSSFAGMNIIPETPEQAMFSLYGKGSNIVSSGAKFVTNPTSENFGAFARQPISTLSGAAEGFFLSKKNKDGTYTYYNPNDGQTESVRTSTEAHVRAGLGLKPLHETIEKKKELLLKSDTKFREQQRTKLLDKITENIAEIENAKEAGSEFRKNAATARLKNQQQQYLKLGGDESSLDKVFEEYELNRSKTTHNERTKIRALDADSNEGIMRLKKLKDLYGR